MKSYQCIIAALDIYSEYEQVLQSALCVAKAPSQISLIFVTLPLSHFQPYISTVGIECVASIRLEAKKRLFEIAREFDIPVSNVHAPVGDIAGEISQMANKIKADLVLIGTQNGDQRRVLLDSVANTILNYLKQDVLAIRNNNNSLIS